MSTRARYRNGVLGFFDGTTYENVLPAAPVVFQDDFLGQAIDTTRNWTALDTSAAGLTTPVLVANSPSGIVSLPLDNTNEAQLSGLYQNDVRNFVLNQGLVFEARVKLSVLPTGAVIVCIGLMGNHNAAADSVFESIWFRLDGSGVVTVETDDTVTETSKVATGVTLLATDWALLTIDCNDPTSIKFYINGVQVAASTTFDMSTVPTLALQPIFRIGKGAAVTVGTLQVDSLRVWQKRAA